MLPIWVEAALATGEVEEASRAAEQLEAMAHEYGTAFYAASARQARGAVQLAQGQAEEALRGLRRALKLWQELDAPYEAGQVRMLLAQVEGGEILTSQETLEAAGDSFTASAARPVSLKGISRPIDVCAIVWQASWTISTTGRSRAHSGRRAIHLVGLRAPSLLRLRYLESHPSRTSNDPSNSERKTNARD